jgi:hypothetical protein
MCWEKIENSDANCGCEALFGTLVAASGGQWALESGIVVKLLELAAGALERGNATSSLLNYIKLLSDVSESHLIKEFIVGNKWHLRIYEALKVDTEIQAVGSHQSVLKKFDAPILEETLCFLKKSSIGDSVVE